MKLLFTALAAATATLASERHIVTRDYNSTLNTDAFIDGLTKANNGGTFVIPAGVTYTLDKKLDLTFLKDVQLQLDGTIIFTDDIEYWQKNNFYHPFQKSISFWRWGGEDVKIFGSGTIDGNGQAWYDGFSGLEILDPDNTYYRPILFYTENATNLEVQGIKFLNSPCWTTFFVTSKNIVFDNVYMKSASTNASSLPKNTDGFDSYNVDGLTVTNSYIDVGDDCFSPKPNTTNILVRNLTCIGTHGVSMGSIGQYPGTLDYISNALLENITLIGATTGARLKAWAGPNVGYGYMRNITYRDIIVERVDAPIVLDQCYFSVEDAVCREYPSRVNISDVTFENVRGSSSGVNGRVGVDLKCSPGATCEGIHLKGIQLTTPQGEAQTVCENIAGAEAVPCP
ncbi:glycoside hydrolase family 28 protein [Aulographum hederae CBS 113979]|uniref:galacturonan 1,4-alpha-galacturonidase n=1 Tax=Aulographum hederae CBS 113979 TaxID=1176131 RepID=A0A6G1GQ41_9PEZI|nr:glycoside hydrolase family 28 protein [Aulographum hederae CBS 113979]